MAEQRSIVLEDYYAPWDRWFENRVYPSPGGLTIFFTEITERKREEQRRGEVGTRLRLALEASNVGLWDWDLATDRVHYSREWKRQIGYQDDEISDDFDEWRSRCHPDDLAGVLARIEAYRRDPSGPYESEFRFRHRDGRWLWILARAEMIRDPAGNSVRMLGCHVDMTARKLAEQALAASEDRYRDLVDHCEDLICTHDLEGRILSINPWAARLLGREPRELARTNVRELLAPAVRQEFATYLATIRRDGVARGLMRVETATGEQRIWKYHNTLRTEGVPAPIVRGMAHDITDRWRAEQALKLSEARFRALFDGAPDGLFVTDREGRFVDVNPAGARMVGSSRERILGLAIGDLAAEEEFEHVGPALEQVGSGAAYVREWKVRRSDGSTFDGEVTGTAMPDGSLLGILRDVTARKQMEEALRRSREVLHLFVENAPAAIAMFDREMRYLATSRRYLLDYQLGERDLVGRSHYEIFPEIPERWRQVHRRCLAGATESAEDDPFPRADGRLDWVRWEIRPWHESGGEIGGILLFSEVVTERKRAEEALRGLPGRLLDAQEEERRRIARELHDELGQVVTAAKLSLEAVERRATPREAEKLRPALSALERALAASRDLAVELRPSVLDDLGLAPALRWHVDRFVRATGLATHLAIEIGEARLSPEIETVCFRVAQEALTNAARHGAATEVWLALQRQGDRLTLSVRDDGRGFDPEAAWARAARGEALGLVGMRERASLVGGELEVRSRPGGGSEVRVVLPAATAARLSPPSGTGAP